MYDFRSKQPLIQMRNRHEPLKQRSRDLKLPLGTGFTFTPAPTLVELADLSTGRSLLREPRHRPA